MNTYTPEEFLKVVLTQGKAEKWFLDMDGTLAIFPDDTDDFRELCLQKGFYAALEPYSKMLEFVDKLCQEVGKENVFICSAGPTKQSYKEKMWWASHLTPIPKKNMITLPVGSNKAEVVMNFFGVSCIDTFVLFDDYTKNCEEWQEAGGIAIKILNEKNGKKGTWTGEKLLAI